MSEPAGDRKTVNVGGNFNIVADHGSSVTQNINVHNTAPATEFRWRKAWDFADFDLDRKRRNFVGREWLFHEIDAWLETGTDQALLIQADYGVGKSAFVAELIARNPRDAIVAFHCCQARIHDTLKPDEFVWSIATQISRAFPAYAAYVKSQPELQAALNRADVDATSAFERAVLAPLRKLDVPGDGSKFIVIDALDESLEFDGAQGRQITRHIVELLGSRAGGMPKWLRVLATTRDRRDVITAIQEPFATRIIPAEDQHNIDDLRNYVLARAATGVVEQKLEAASVSAEALAETITKKSGGKFLYAVKVLNAIGSGALPLDRLDDLPPGMDGFYMDAFERRFPEHQDYAPVSALLGVLCVEREPMSEAELSAILGRPDAQVGNMLQRLEDFLRVDDKRVGDERYAFDHFSLAQWLCEKKSGFRRAGRFSVAPKAAEAQIAGWARRELAADCVHESAYLARHLGAYLSPPERKVHFARLLFDFRWLDARLRAAGVNALLSDVADVGGTPALEALARALRHGAHVLGHEGSDWLGADLLASQILGRLQSQADPEVHALCMQAAGQLARNAGLRPVINSLRKADTLSRTLAGHTRPVTALAILTGGRLASGSRDNTVRLWDPANGVCEATLEGHTSLVCAFAVLAGGQLASGSWDQTIRLWDPVRGVCVATLEGHTELVSALAAPGDGRLASGSGDNTIKLWNPESGICDATLEGHTDVVSALAPLSGGRLASASYDTTIRLWDPVNGVCETTLEGHTGSVHALAVLANGRLASGSRDKTIRLWNTTTGACEGTLEGHTGHVSALAALADGRLASASSGRTIRLWNPATGACEAIFEGHASYPFCPLAVLADGRLASGSPYGEIHLWNPASGVCGASPEGHRGDVTALAVLADGRVASGSAVDHTIRLWDPASGVCEAMLHGHKSCVSALAVLADGRLASGESWYQTIRLWNPATGACEATLEGGFVNALAVLADGRLASGSGAGIRLWSPATGVCDATLEGRMGVVNALAVLSDGRLASAGSEDDDTIRLWSPLTGVCESTLKGHRQSVRALAVLADGRLASASTDRTIRLWNLASGSCEANLTGHTGSVEALAVLADGRLISASSDRTIRIWEFRNDRWRGAVGFVGDACIRTLAFAARAGMLAAGDSSGCVHFLKVEAPVSSQK